MAVRAVTFAQHDCDRFVDDVKSRVAEYFKTNNLDIKANTEMVTKSVILVSLLVVPYLLIMLAGFPLWAMWALAALMGVAMAGIGFSVSHDALHGAYSHNPRVNDAIGYTFDLLGASGYMWKITHNVIHHTYTNIHGIDEDLEVSPLLRLSPLAKHSWFHRAQHIYAPFAYALSTLNWVFVKDFDYFRRRTLGPYLDKKHPKREVAILFASKIFAFTWQIVLPLVLLPITWWQFLIGFVTFHVVGGIILGIIFQLAHVVEQTSHPVPDNLGKMPNGWLVHEMLTTANFCVGNRLLTWYCGGLNHQIEHHLFPKTCSVHYPAISRIVREVAAENGIPYHHNPTFLGAFASHLSMLKKLGAAEAPNIVRAPVAA